MSSFALSTVWRLTRRWLSRECLSSTACRQAQLVIVFVVAVVIVADV